MVGSEGQRYKAVLSNLPLPWMYSAHTKGSFYKMQIIISKYL